MNKYSESSSAPDATHTVSYDRVFKKGDEEVDEEEYAPEDMGKAYKVIKDFQHCDKLPIVLQYVQAVLSRSERAKCE